VFTDELLNWKAHIILYCIK